MLVSVKDKGFSVLFNMFVIIIICLFLSGCSGGVSGVMSSSGFGHWKIYKVNYPRGGGLKLDKPIEVIIEDVLFNSGFKKKTGWGSPVLVDAMVATFKQNYMDRYISLDVQISRNSIIFMTTSYSDYTKVVFDGVESELADIFGETNIETCFGRKDLNGHSCFQ
jgi:hypothetical protein